MKYFLFLFCILHICYADLVQELVEGITDLKEQILTWTYPQNSNTYKGANYDPNAIIFDGNYDFIICGAGISGSLIANRLSQISSWNILLIEAGDVETNITEIPKMAKALKTSKYNWGYFTTPQNGFNGYIGNKLPIIEGKAVGGNSAVDFMSYVRGNKQDYNKWGSLNPGWTYLDVLPYFKKSENATFPNVDPNYHGTSGEINVEYSRVFNNIGQAFLDSYLEMGRKNLDYNAANQMGASRLQLIQEKGKRESSASAFLTPVQNNSNLHIFTNSFITKLLINNTNKQVYGVQYLRDGVLHNATVRKEVILCAEALNTPQLLMLSGIGPKEHLEELNIPVIQDLKVGSNLWDHLVYSHNVFKINITEAEQDLQQQVEEYLDGSGPLTAPFALQAIGFSNVMDTIGGNIFNVPDVEYLFHSSTEPEDNYTAYKNLEGYTQETYDTVIKPTLGFSQWALDIIALHPNSRGTVRLQSPSAFEFPVIDPNYFSDSSDVIPFIKAIYDTMDIAQTKAFQKYNSTLTKVCHPACDCNNWGTEAFWGCMVQNLAKSLHEFGGTAKMGPITDPTAVVDNTLRVHGMRGLRVADCSVIPNTISGNINAAAYMIGEKASSLIKATYFIDIILNGNK